MLQKFICNWGIIRGLPIMLNFYIFSNPKFQKESVHWIALKKLFEIASNEEMRWDEQVIWAKSSHLFWKLNQLWLQTLFSATCALILLKTKNCRRKILSLGSIGRLSLFQATPPPCTKKSMSQVRNAKIRAQDCCVGRANATLWCSATEEFLILLTKPFIGSGLEANGMILKWYN